MGATSGVVIYFCFCRLEGSGYIVTELPKISGSDVAISRLQLFWVEVVEEV